MMNTDKLYKKYLTDEQINRINNGTLSEEEKREILQKYNNILRILSTYLPQNIVKTKVENYNSSVHDGRFVEGTLLFVDVNGFTALTERLNRHGNEGSEEITRILNKFFSDMMDIIFKFHGVLLKYGGDAMMIYFSAANDFCGELHAYNALSCAFEMKNKMSDYEKVESRFGTFLLSISIAVHSDIFYETSLGDPEIHTEYFLTGNGVEITADIEGYAGKNEILICEETLFRVREYVLSFEKKDKYILVKEFEGLKLPPASGAMVKIDYEDIYELFVTLDSLKGYLIQGIYDKIQSSWQKLNLEGEYRIVSVIFLNYYFSKDIFSELGIGKEEEIHAILKEYFTVVQDTVNNFDGAINKVDMYKQGDKIIIIFGFPRSHFDDEERAIRCSQLLIDNAKKFKNITFAGCNFSIIQKIGIHTGFIYAGNVGSPLRKEFTIMGDTVNLSARIMSGAGEDEIWISDVIYKKAQGISLIKKTEERQFKGKSGLITIHQLGGIIKESSVTNEIFIGRKKEKELLMSLFEKVNEEPAAIQILGSVGVGKTALLREFLKSVTVRNELLIGRGIPYGKNIQYNAIKEILVHYFGITNKDDEAKIENKINMYLKFLKLENLSYSIPLIGAILTDGFKNSAILEIEDPIAKKEILFKTFSKLIEARSKLGSIIFVIEDGEWLDKNSQDIIVHLIKQRIPGVFVILLSRKEIVLNRNVHKMDLGVLSKEQTDEFIAAFPGLEKITEDLKNQIYEKSKGVPYFIYEILNSIRDQGSHAELPESIYKSVFSRLDLLSEKHKEIIKKASVIGVEFSIPLLNKILGGIKDEEKLLERLIEEDFILKKDEETYIFRNMMVQEVAYNSLSFSKKKQLHMEIGNLYEQEGDLAAKYEILSAHFEKAEIYEKAIYYYDKSGDKATRLNNYKKAIDYFQKALSLIEKSGTEETHIRQEVDILRKIGKIYLIIGDIDSAYTTYEKVFAIAEKYNFKPDIADCLLNNGLIHMNRHEFEDAVNSFERAAKIYSELADFNGLASTHLNLGLIYKLLGKGTESFKNYEKALHNYLKTDNVSGCADAYNNMGNLSKETGNYEDAIKYYEKAMSMFEKIGHEIGLASVCNNIGTLFNSMGSSEKAVEYFLKSLGIEQKIGNEKGRAVCYNNLGNSYVRVGNWKLANENFTAGLEIAYNIKDNKEIANIYLNHGVMHIYTEDFENAKVYLKNAGDIYLTLKDYRGIYSSNYNLGLIYQKESDNTLAKDFFEKSISAARKLDFKVFAEACLNIARNYIHLKNYDEAKDVIEEGVQAIQNSPFNTLKAQLFQFAAKIYKILGKTQIALSYMQKTIELKKVSGDLRNEAYALIQVALILKESGDVEKAKITLKDAKKIFTDINDTIGKIFCDNKIGLMYYTENKFGEAVKYFYSNAEDFQQINADIAAAMVYKKIAYIYYKEKELMKSVEMLAKALVIEEAMAAGELTTTYRMIGSTLLEMDEFNRAVDYLEKCYEIEMERNSSTKDELAYQLGKLYKSREKFGSAIIYFERCAGTLNEALAEKSLKELAILYERVGQKERLRHALRRLLVYERNIEKKTMIAECINLF